MNKCPLCGSETKAVQPDYGRGPIVISCPICGDYETHDEAIGHIENKRFGDHRRKAFSETVKEINRLGEVAEITVNDHGEISAQAKGQTRG